MAKMSSSEDKTRKTKSADAESTNLNYHHIIVSIACSDADNITTEEFLRALIMGPVDLIEMI